MANSPRDAEQLTCHGIFPPSAIRCLLPWFDGLILSQEWKEALWDKFATIEDLRTGPKKPRSTVLTKAEEAMVVAFRRHTLLPLDDCLYAL